MKKVDFTPETHICIHIEDKDVILRGKKEKLIRAYAFFLMPHLDEDLALQIEDYVEDNMETILGHMKRHEASDA